MTKNELIDLGLAILHTRAIRGERLTRPDLGNS
jgi:hypothetical protein